MTAEQFAYWLNGFIELTEWKQPTPEQWKSVCEHLESVFVKVTPPVNAPIAPTISIEEALRRHRESEQGKKNPYGPNLPCFGSAPVLTC